MYPNEKGKRFDVNYFATKHIGLVHKKLDGAGLVRAEVDKAADPNAAEFTADMPNYTDLVPQVQISEIVK
jgi:hypothetical protein